jgi:hypothetical protein
MVATGINPSGLHSLPISCYAHCLPVLNNHLHTFWTRYHYELSEKVQYTYYAEKKIRIDRSKDESVIEKE